MNLKLLNHYAEARKPSHMVYHNGAHLWQATAQQALQQARYAIDAEAIADKFEALGEDSVRLKWSPEGSCSFNDLVGDMFEPDCFPFNPNGIEQAKQNYIDTINRDGLWYVEAQFWSDLEQCWGIADSIGMIEGQPEDVNGYGPDLMQSAIDAFETENSQGFFLELKRA